MKIKKTLDISIDMAREWYNSGNETLRKLALECYSVDELKVVSFEEIKTFEDAVNVLNLNIDDVYITINRLEKISKASAAMFKLNIIRKALNLGQDLYLTKDSEDSCIYYPYNPIVTKSSTYYKSEIDSGKMEVIGKIKSEGEEYNVLGGGITHDVNSGLGGFNYQTGICKCRNEVSLLGCATKEIAKHFGKYFGMLITTAKYADKDFEVIESKYII